MSCIIIVLCCLICHSCLRLMDMVPALTHPSLPLQFKVFRVRVCATSLRRSETTSACATPIVFLSRYDINWVGPRPLPEAQMLLLTWTSARPSLSHALSLGLSPSRTGVTIKCRGEVIGKQSTVQCQNNKHC